MPRKRIRAILFGPQGSGKTTQGLLLAERYGVPFIEARGALQDEIEGGSAMGKLVQEYVEAKVLAPDDLVNAVMVKHLKKAADQGFILDGYPRNVEQAESLDKIAKIQLAVQFKMNDERAVKRLDGRYKEDDARRKLALYHFMTEPMASYYRQRGVLLAVNADQKMEDLQEELIKKMRKLGFSC